MTVSNEIYEVVTRSQRRRRWPLAEKKRIIEETYTSGMSLSMVARKYQIAPAQVFSWRKAMEQGGMVGIQSEEEVVPKSEVKALKSKIKELERALGRQTMKVEILKEAVTIAREKKLISRQPLLGLDDFE